MLKVYSAIVYIDNIKLNILIKSLQVFYAAHLWHIPDDVSKAAEEVTIC